jgi:hypothetical protein
VTMETLLACYDDVLATFAHNDVPSDLPDLLRRLMQQGIDAGLAHEQVTALTKVLRR